MAFKKKKEKMLELNLVPMIDITSFILLALGILAMTGKKEASLDHILRLPPVLHAAKQDTTQLQIYILPAKVLAGGAIDPESTGLVAFMDKAKVPDQCPRCSLAFRDAKAVYFPNSLLDLGGKPVAALQAPAKPEDNPEKAKAISAPPAYICSRCRFEISPYLKLDDIPISLKKKKMEILKTYVFSENYYRTEKKLPLLTEAETKKIEEGIPLMIKADDKAFYGRILEVVNMARDTVCDIKKFVFVTLAEASLEAQRSAPAQEAK